MNNAELGRLIQQGLSDKRVIEDSTSIIQLDGDEVLVDPIGAALLGKYKDPDEVHFMYLCMSEVHDAHFRTMAELLDVDPDLLMTISHVSKLGVIDARGIAAELIAGRFPEDIPQHLLP